MKDRNSTGFWKPLTSNHTYTPNQFFDVVLPQANLTVARIVGFMIRQTIGWTDKDNRPCRRQLEFTQAELARVLNLHENSIHNNLRKACEANFIECVSKGTGHKRGAQPRPSVYRLKWSSGSRYTTNPDEFDGFLPGQGNRTVVPNQYFDEILLTESLAVIKLVGLIIRKTIGWVDNFGNRKIQDAVSYVEFMREMAMSRYAVAEGVKTSLRRGYVRVPEKGRMKRKGAVGNSATYTLFWLSDEHALSQCPDPDRVPATKIRPIRPQKSDRSSHKNQTDKTKGIKQNPSKIFKQQQRAVESSESFIHSSTRKAPAAEAIDGGQLTALTARGIPVDQARQVLKNLRPDQLVWDQLEYTDSVVTKGTIENPVGFLITFLKENRPVPPTFVSSRQRTLARLRELAREELREAYDAYKEREVDRYIQEHDLHDQYQSRIAARKQLYTSYLGKRSDEELTRAARHAVQDEIAAEIPRLQSEEEFFWEYWG